MTARRGFTLIELMLAASLSGLAMTAILMALFGVWSMAKQSSDELQGALQARVIREKLYYGFVEYDGERYGLVNATNVTVTRSGLTAMFPNGKSKSVSSKKVPLYLEQPSANSNSRKYHDSRSMLQNVYLSFNPGSRATKPDSTKTLYYERIVVPVFGRKISESADETVAAQSDPYTIFKNNY